MITLNETQRRRRGHAFLPPKTVLAKIPALYETENIKSPDKMVWIHYFTSNADWYLCEVGENEGQLLGYNYCRPANNPGGSWGYADLAELEELSVLNGRVIVERDKWWTPCKFSEITRHRHDQHRGRQGRHLYRRVPGQPQRWPVLRPADQGPGRRVRG